MQEAWTEWAPLTERWAPSLSKAKLVWWHSSPTRGLRKQKAVSKRAKIFPDRNAFPFSCQTLSYRCAIVTFVRNPGQRLVSPTKHKNNRTNSGICAWTSLSELSHLLSFYPQQHPRQLSRQWTKVCICFNELLIVTKGDSSVATRHQRRDAVPIKL